jgi:translation elongation factor EF-1alpha
LRFQCDKIERGDVIGEFNFPPNDVDHLIATIMNVCPGKKIKTGYQPLFFVHSAFVPCTVELVRMVDKKSGEVTGTLPTELKSTEMAEVKITPLKPVSLDKFSDYKDLGRFLLKDGSSRHVGVKSI